MATCSPFKAADPCEASDLFHKLSGAVIDQLLDDVFFPGLALAGFLLLAWALLSGAVTL